MNKTFSLISLFALSVALNGCTPYTSSGLLGGYSEQQLDANIWKISFEGNGYTSRKRATDFTTLRCAEITLEQGYRYFAITDQNSVMDYMGTYNTGAYNGNVNLNSRAMGNTVYTNGSYHGNSFGTSFAIRAPSADQTIVMFKKRPKGVIVYDAQMICRNVGAEYGIICSTMKNEKKGSKKK